MLTQSIVTTQVDNIYAHTGSLVNNDTLNIQQSQQNMPAISNQNMTVSRNMSLNDDMDMPRTSHGVFASHQMSNIAEINEDEEIVEDEKV